MQMLRSMDPHTFMVMLSSRNMRGTAFFFIFSAMAYSSSLDLETLYNCLSLSCIAQKRLLMLYIISLSEFQNIDGRSDIDRATPYSMC